MNHSRDDLGEDLVAAHQARAVAEGVEQLVPGELADRGVGEAHGHGLRAGGVDRVVAADGLEPLQVLEARVVGGLQVLELGRVAGREREQVQHVRAEEAGRVEEPQLAGDHRAAVAAVDAVAVVAEAAHQRVVGAGDAGHGPAAVDHRRAEAEPRHRRDDERELRRAAARSRRGSRGTSRGRCGRAAAAWRRGRRRHVQEVDRLAVDLGEVLRVGVHPRFLGAPVERRAPVLHRLGQVVVGHAVVPVVAGDRAGGGGCGPGGRRGRPGRPAGSRRGRGGCSRS